MKHSEVRHPISKRRHWGVAALLLGLAMSFSACEEDEPSGPYDGTKPPSGTKPPPVEEDDTKEPSKSCEKPWHGSGQNPFLGKWGYSIASLDGSSQSHMRYWFNEDGTFTSFWYLFPSRKWDTAEGCYKITGNQILLYARIWEKDGPGEDSMGNFEFVYNDYSKAIDLKMKLGNYEFTYMRCDNVDPPRC